MRKWDDGRHEGTNPAAVATSAAGGGAVGVRPGRRERAAAESVRTVPEDRFVADRFSPQHLALGVRLDDCVYVAADKREGARPVWSTGSVTVRGRA